MAWRSRLFPLAFSRRARWLAIMMGTGTVTLAALYFLGFTPLLGLEYYSQDLRARLGRKTPADPRLVFLGIDQASYHDILLESEIQDSPILKELAKTFPWSRAVWAALIERLCNAGAKVVALDLLFAAPGDGDDALQATLEKFRDRVVIGSNFTDLQGDQGTTISHILPEESILPPPSAPRTAAQDDRVGYVNIWPDEDGVVRRARFRLVTSQFLSSTHLTKPAPAEEEICESLAARALRKSDGPDRVPSGFESKAFRFTGPPGSGYRPHPIYQVFLPKFWENNFRNGQFFRGKIVVVGPAANFFHDEHPTPFSSPQPNMVGPEIHLNILGAARQGEFLVEASRSVSLALIVWAGLTSWTLFTFLQKPWKRFLGVGLTFLLWAGLSQWLFDRANLIWPAATPALTLLVCSVAGLGYDFLHERVEKTRFRRTLERYVSKDIVKELLDNPATYYTTLGGVRKPVTVLFSDVRGFTTLTESADSAQLVRQLNEYFSEMVRHVFAFKGTLDKFIGDAVMAVWGSMVSEGPERDAEHAVATALAMRSSLARLNETWRARGWPELAFGIGINHGEAIVGNLGSTQKMELTVIGDAVNLASRLEGLTREYRLDLLIGESVASLVREKYVLRTVDRVQVKGKTKPVEVFTVSAQPGPSSEVGSAWLARFEEGISLYRRRAFPEAARAFSDCLAQHEDDYLSRLYQQRCENLLAHPPDDSWNGAFVATQK